MRIPPPLLSAILASAPLALGDFTQVDVVWSDNFDFNMPLTDNAGTTLEGGDVVQVGYFAGVDPAKDPGTYTAQDWASFTPLTGDGSPNAGAFPTVINLDFPGYITFSIPFDTSIHSGVANSDVRVGIRIYDADTVAGATNLNTVSSSLATWIMKKPGDENNIPFPANADMDFAHNDGSLVWEGTPFKTDLVPGATPAALVLTGVSRVDPTTLQISWAGGDGPYHIQTSTTGEDGSWTDAKTGVASSPTTIEVTPTSVKKLLVRVVEP